MDYSLMPQAGGYRIKQTAQIAARLRQLLMCHLSRSRLDLIGRHDLSEEDVVSLQLQQMTIWLGLGLSFLSYPLHINIFRFLTSHVDFLVF